MKKFLLASVAAVAMAGSASAADLGPRMPTKAPPMVAPPPPPFTWTGCYLGGHGGYGWGRKTWSDDTPERPGSPPLFFIGGFVDNNSASVSHDTKGWLGGGQVGCDYQISSGWVIGIEGSGSAADIKGSVHDPFFAIKNFHATTDWLASVTGRVGFTWIPRVLLYARGGAAWAGDKYSAFDIDDDQPFTAPSQTRSGFTVGGGIEWAFSPGWSAFVEYDFYDFGTRLVNFTRVGSPSDTPNADIKQDINVVKFGINWRFNWGKGKAPIVARY
jgi:outer membrane immunogenic protein